MTALVVALCFTLSLFFAPLVLAIPAAATAPVLVVAGFYLFGSVRHISGSRPKEVIPAFLCILLMPITGSIADGIIFGLATHIILSILENWAKHFRKPTTPEADEAGTELEED
jgi:AGZA family xanthine/uracil permease-like MFS transporter